MKEVGKKHVFGAEEQTKCEWPQDRVGRSSRERKLLNENRASKNNVENFMRAKNTQGQ